MEQEIPQTVGHQLVVMETMLLKHVRMRPNDDLHAKGHEMFYYMKLIRESLSIKFFSEVHENYNDVHFSLFNDIKKQLRQSFNIIKIVRVKHKHIEDNFLRIIKKSNKPGPGRWLVPSRLSLSPININ